MTRAARTIAGIATGIMAAIATTSADQTPASGSSAGAVIGTGVFTSFVENMDRSLAFYRDAFGMEVPALPASGERPYNAPNPRLFEMFDILGARERHQSARVTGTPVTLEIMEIQNVEHATIPMRVQDPGIATLVLIVRDIDAALARARQANAVVVTPGGAPVACCGGGRAILIRDLDSRPIILRQPANPATGQAASSASDVLDMQISIAVANLEKTVAVYRDTLGFSVLTVGGDTVARADAEMRTLTGLTTASVRRSLVYAPGSGAARKLAIELVEFTNVDRRDRRMRIQDRGAARLQLRAENLDALVEAMKSAGLRVDSVGGRAVPIPPNLKGALVADPNGFFLTPFAPCDGCAPTLAPAAC